MGGGYGRGLSFLKEQQESIGMRRDRMRKLWLKGGETARIYFVQDHTDIAVPLVHMVQAKKKNGEPYNKDVACARRTLSDDPASCGYCQTEGVKGPWPRTVAIVWCDVIIHPTRKETSWEPTKVGDTVVYREDVNDYQLLIMRDKVVGQLSAYLQGDPLDQSKPTPTTILDLGWKFSAIGEGANKVELLEPGSPLSGEVAKAVAAARESAPDLDKVLLSEFGVPGGGRQAAGEATVASGAALVSYDEVPADLDAGLDSAEEITF